MQCVYLTNISIVLRSGQGLSWGNAACGGDSTAVEVTACCENAMQMNSLEATHVPFIKRRWKVHNKKKISIYDATDATMTIHFLLTSFLFVFYLD